MKTPRLALTLILFRTVPILSFVAGTALTGAQNAAVSKSTPIAATAPTSVPALIPYTGIAQGRDGKPLSGEISATFLIFKDDQGGEPLWVETQTVAIDAAGQYQVHLGASSPAGLPAATFASGEGRWLEVQIAGQAPQPRVLLASVPYAMKAAEAETLGGLPSADYVTQAQLAATAKNLTERASPLITPFVAPTGGGTTNYIPLWTGSSALGNSYMFQSGPNVYLGSTTTPSALNVTGNISNAASGTYPNFTSSAYDNVNYEGPRMALNRYEGTIASPAVVKPGDTVGFFDFFGYDGSTLQRVAEFAATVGGTPSAGIVPGQFGINTANSLGVDTPRLIAYSNDNVTMSTHGGKVGIGTLTPTANLEVNGTAKFDGNIIFASTQAFPITGTGGGTISGISTASPLSGGGSAGTVTLGLNTAALETTLDARYALLGAQDSFTTEEFFNSGIQSKLSLGPNSAALLGLGSNGSTGVYGTSDTSNAGGFSNASAANAAVYANNTANADDVHYPTAINGTSSGTGSAGVYGLGTLYGVWGDAGGVSGATAVYGSAADGYAGSFYSTGADYPTLYADNSAAGSEATPPLAIQGRASGDYGYGVAGDEAGSAGYGVYGYATGGFGSDTGIASVGTYGMALQGIGVMGVRAGNSNVFGLYQDGQLSSAAVWGDSSSVHNPASDTYVIASIVGTADNNVAGYFINDSATYSSVQALNLDEGATGLFKTFQASTRDGTCGFGSGGSMTCTGPLKSLASTGQGTRAVETYSVQSSENWMEDAGAGELVRGVALVHIDPAFAETISADASYHVFITPNGDSDGLYVIAKTPTTFEVRESKGGTSSLSFDYRIMAKRRGMETQRLVDVTDDLNRARKVAVRGMPSLRGTQQGPRRMAAPPIPQRSQKPAMRPGGASGPVRPKSEPVAATRP
jgi:hypothetical protein